MADPGDEGPDAPEARQGGIYRLVIAAHMLDVAAPQLPTARRSPRVPGGAGGPPGPRRLNVQGRNPGSGDVFSNQDLII